MFECFVHSDAKERGVVCLSDGEVVDFEFDGLGGLCGVEDGVLSFGWVWYEEVAVEILYEVVEFCVSEWVEFLFCICSNDQCGVVSVGVDFGVGDCVDDIVDIEEEEGCRKCAALWDAVRDCLCFGLGVLGV